MKIDKQNGDVCFNDENHIYWNLKDNSKYISVTTLIERFGQPFDESFWSAYKALEKIMEPEAWKIERSKLLDTKKFDKSLLEGCLLRFFPESDTGTNAAGKGLSAFADHQEG